MKTYDPNQPFVFLGLPLADYEFYRTALQHLFGKHYLDLAQRPDADLSEWWTADDLPDGRWLPKIECASGFFDAGTGNAVETCCPATSQFVMVMADPVLATAQRYEQAKQDSKAGTFWYRGKSSHIDSHFRSQDEFLDQFPRSLYWHLPQTLTLDNCEAWLAQRFVCAGVAEDPAGSLAGLAEAIGRSTDSTLDLTTSKYNDPPSSAAVSDRARERFEHNFPLLVRVYEFAKQATANA